MLKAQKRKLSDELNRVILLQNELFPNQSLQERQLNFSEFYLESGDLLIEKIIKKMSPLENEFSILELLNEFFIFTKKSKKSILVFHLHNFIQQNYIFNNFINTITFSQIFLAMHFISV